MKKYFLTVFFIIVLLIALAYTGITRPEKRDTGKLLPYGLVIKDKFRKGFGSSVGKVIHVSGRVVIYHQNRLTGYLAKSRLPLFKGDTIVCLDNGSLQIRLNDSSRLRIGNKTKIVLNKSSFSKNAKDRSVFLNLIEGRARFWLKKLLHFKRSEFRIKTNTVIAGVRGSDFVIIAAPEYTKIVTFENTGLSIIDPVMPDAPPVILSEFEMLLHKKGRFITQPEKIDPEMMKQLQEELPFEKEPPEGGTTDSSLYNKEIVIDKDRLIFPESTPESGPERFKPGSGDEALESLMDQQKTIFQIKHEETLKNKMEKDRPQ